MAESAGPTVLFIDDDPDILKLMDLVFSKHSYQLITRHTPEEGLRVLSQRAVDCVLLDVACTRAPEAFGFVASLANTPGGAAVPCLVTSAMHAREVEERVLNLGARKFIQKPFYPSEILDAVRAAVGPATVDN